MVSTKNLSQQTGNCSTDGKRSIDLLTVYHVLIRAYLRQRMVLLRPSEVKHD